MTSEEVLQSVGLDEDCDREFKSARGGFPGSFWESYSAMANSEGGTIILGVEEEHGQFWIGGLESPSKTQKTFWDTLNNRNKVSRNLLTPSDAKVVLIGEKSVFVVHVRKATRKERPIFIGQNPLGSTFRRNYQGDYRCPDEEVGRMLADQSEEPADSRILTGFSLDDLDLASLQQYRNRFSARDPQHPWLNEDNLGLLQKLGGWRKDRVTNEEGLTVAGLLMFGKDEAIRDPSALPKYHVDYQEKTSEDAATRWDDRLYPDGKWCANLFQFYQAVYPKLTQGLKVPFQLGMDMFRRDETPVHEAIREALVNALIHADYHGTGGIVIVRTRDRIVLWNPGSLLVSIQQLREGGISECRNKALQQMFQMIGGAEKAGSGIDKIIQGWRSQRWTLPGVLTQFDPDRVTFLLPFTSFLSEDSKGRLRERFGEIFDGLSAEECLALVLAETEGEVSNARLQLTSQSHPADLSQMLRSLVRRGFLVPDGEKRTTGYRLPPGHPNPSLPFGENSLRNEGDLSHNPNDSLHNVGDSLHKATHSSHKAGDSQHNQVMTALSSKDRTELINIASLSRDRERLNPVRMNEVILRLCEGRWLRGADIAELLQRNPQHVRNRLLTTLVNQGRLEMLFPDRPNRPDQAYRTRLDSR